MSALRHAAPDPDARKFLEWESERTAFLHVANSPGRSEDETDHWVGMAEAVEKRILHTPGHSADAILVKARTLRSIRESELDAVGVRTLDEIIAFLGDPRARG